MKSYMNEYEIATVYKLNMRIWQQTLERIREQNWESIIEYEWK